MKSATPEYRAWGDMKQRCLNPKHKSFHAYGGRGITVCNAWLQFDGFLADMGPRPTDRHSIDRINVNGNYEPGNCRWAEPATQSRNMRAHLREGVGVVFSARDNCWGAWIAVGGKSVRVGSYLTQEAAIHARKEAEERYWKAGETPPNSNGIQRNNTSGCRGVSWSKQRKKWEAYFYKSRKRQVIGAFDDLSAAINARTSFAHGIKPQEPTDGSR